jgi:4-oxalmesaconate hydratase
MIIDCHGHFTTTPPQVAKFRADQIAEFNRTGITPTLAPPPVSDEEIRRGISENQLRIMRERGIDLTIFSPRAVGMDHHTGNEETNVIWARYSNELIHRAVQMFPQEFIGVCQLPQAPGVAPGARVFEELDRCINEFGFIGANLNPDPSGGRWSDPPLWDKKWWYPLYEKMVALDIPAMIHVSGSCNPHFNPAVATHYINGDTTAFVQFLTSDIFKDFPTLKFIIPHGGGAAPYHWGRYRGIALDMGLKLEEKILDNVFFDTCVYHQPGIDLLLKVVPTKNVLFASETVGAVQGIDPLTNFYFDDTKRYIDASTSADAAQKKQIYSSNALGVYPRLRAHPKCQGC